MLRPVHILSWRIAVHPVPQGRKQSTLDPLWPGHHTPPEEWKRRFLSQRYLSKEELSWKHIEEHLSRRGEHSLSECCCWRVHSLVEDWVRVPWAAWGRPLPLLTDGQLTSPTRGPYPHRKPWLRFFADAASHKRSGSLKTICRCSHRAWDFDRRLGLAITQKRPKLQRKLNLIFLEFSPRFFLKWHKI